MLPKAVDLGISEHNKMVSDISHVMVDMFMLPMFLLHNIQQVVAKEIKAHDHMVYDELKQSNRTMSLLQSRLEYSFDLLASL